MTIEEAHKEEMIHYIEQAIERLELAMNVIECDEKFSNGQSQVLNGIYDKANEVVEILKTIVD